MSEGAVPAVTPPPALLVVSQDPSPNARTAAFLCSSQKPLGSCRCWFCSRLHCLFASGRSPDPAITATIVSTNSGPARSHPASQGLTRTPFTNRHDNALKPPLQRRSRRNGCRTARFPGEDVASVTPTPTRRRCAPCAARVRPRQSLRTSPSDIYSRFAEFVTALMSQTPQEAQTSGEFPESLGYGGAHSVPSSGGGHMAGGAVIKKKNSECPIRPKMAAGG